MVMFFHPCYSTSGTRPALNPAISATSAPRNDRARVGYPSPASFGRSRSGRVFLRPSSSRSRYPFLTCRPSAPPLARLDARGSRFSCSRNRNDSSSATGDSSSATESPSCSPRPLTRPASRPLALCSSPPGSITASPFPSRGTGIATTWAVTSHSITRAKRRASLPTRTASGSRRM